MRENGLYTSNCSEKVRGMPAVLMKHNVSAYVKKANYSTHNEVLMEVWLGAAMVGLECQFP